MISDPSINKTADQLIGDCINKMTTKPSKLIEKKELKMIGKLVDAYVVFCLGFNFQGSFLLIHNRFFI